MTDHQKYVDYINNTGREPLPVAMFDEDWEPIGPMIRADMVKADLIQVRADSIYLRPDLVTNPLRRQMKLTITGLAAENEKLRTDLAAVLQREADTHARHESREAAAVAAAIEYVALDVLQWDEETLHENTSPEEAADYIRALITPAQADALAAHDKRVREAAVVTDATIVSIWKHAQQHDPDMVFIGLVRALVDAGGDA